jgi:hypothetical protein
MNEIFKTIIIAVITNGSILALFIWVFKRCFDSLLNKRIEAYKMELDLANKKQIHQFSKIYDEQAEVVKAAYGKLIYLYDQMAFLAYHYNMVEQHPELFEDYRIPRDGDPIKWDRYLKTTLTKKTEDVQAEELVKLTSTTLTDFRRNRIYFRVEIANEIERFIYLISLIASHFKDVTYRDPRDFQPVIAEEVIKIWKDAVKAANELFPVIENSFREHIGISTLDA